jgi:hypothetical protein
MMWSTVFDVFQLRLGLLSHSESAVACLRSSRSSRREDTDEKQAKEHNSAWTAICHSEVDDDGAAN